MPESVLRCGMFLFLPIALADGFTWPKMDLSATTVDFGFVPLGSTGTGTFSVTNNGDLPMGLRAEIAGYPDGDFSYAWNDLACDDGTALLPGVELQADTGGGDWQPPVDGQEAAPEPGAEAILPPGCTVTFEVRYAPTAGDRGLAALILTASGDYPHGRSDFQTERPAYAEDPLELRQVVALSGTTDGAAPADGEPGLLAIDGSPDMCREGETIALQAWGFDPDGGALLYSWGADTEKGSALFDDAWAPYPTFTCPEVATECAYEPKIVYLLVHDGDGHQVWGETTVYVFDSSREHAERFVEGVDSCHSLPSPTGPERRCECGESGAVLPLGLVWGTAWRRRRRPR